MRYVLVIVGVVAIIGALFAIKGAQIAKLIGFGKQMEASGPPPEAVSSALATEQEWEELVTATGSVATARGVALSTDVAGVITKISFASGATVKQGEVLVELDANVERAQLASAVARQKLAEQNAARSRQLIQTGSLAPSALDADEGALRNATADAEAISAQIARKTIKAPFSGKLGIRAVNLGQFLSPGTPITIIETTETVHVDFSLPQQRLQDVKLGMPTRITLETDAGVVEGQIAAIDPTVDSATRTARLRADIDESKGADQLRPGMFVNIAIVLPKKGKVTTVPATSLIHATFGDSVFIVEPAKDGAVKIARQQFVRTGEARGDYVAILDGVKPQQEVVTAGAFKLRNNSPVLVDNSKKPLDPKVAPTPENR